METLFKAISGGADWQDLVSPLASLDPSFRYVFFMYFGVLNVVVGAFVATTADIALCDKQALVKTETERLNNYTKHVKEFFRNADLDKNGKLSWEEFEKHLDNREVQAYFNAIELDVSRAQILFDLLDSDGSNQVTIDEFLDGCMRLKGEARSIDLNLLLFSYQAGNDRLVMSLAGVENQVAELLKGQAAGQNGDFRHQLSP